MNYHLNRDGQNLGVFSKEELQRRRATGELTGAELVWTEGMTAWQPLHSVLPLLPPPPISGLPPATQKSGSNRLAIMAAIVGGLLLGAMALGVVGYRMILRPAIKRLVAPLSDATGTPLAQSAAMEAASKPVVTDANTLTAAEATKASREFRIRQYVEGYKLRGERNPECDALALGLVSNWIACNYGGDVDTNLPPLSELGDRLANDPACTDPFLTKAGQMLF